MKEMFDVSFKMTVIITTHDRFRRRVVSQEHTLKIKSREKRIHFMVAHDEQKNNGKFKCRTAEKGSFYIHASYTVRD